MIPIDRDGGLRALKRLMKDAKKSINEERQLIIFPEGSRTYPGATRRVSVRYFLVFINTPKKP